MIDVELELLQFFAALKTYGLKVLSYDAIIHGVPTSSCFFNSYSWKKARVTRQIMSLYMAFLLQMNGAIDDLTDMN